MTEIEKIILIRLIKNLKQLQYEHEETDKEFARTMGRAKDAIRIKFNLKE